MKFRKVKLCDLCSIVTDYVANGSFKTLADKVKYLNVGYARVIRLVDYNNKYSKRDSIWVSKESYEFLEKSKLYGGEIVLSNVGANLGTVFIAPKLKYPTTLGPNAIMIKTNENDKYLYYWLKSKKGQNTIKSIVTGSAMPKFNKTDLKHIEIDIPCIESQNKIVEILSEIDKKIELNNQINDNLLEIGLELLKDDFNKKAEYEVLSNVIKFVKGKKPLDITIEIKEEYEKYLTIACLNGQELNYADPTKMVLSNNDLLMVMDGASSGDVYYGGQGIVGSTLSRVDCIDGNYIPEFIYFIMKYYKGLIQSKNIGSAIPHTDKVFVGSLKIPKLLIEEQEKYKTLLYKTLQNMNENKILEQLRDTLLPKLMNGEIDLDKIEI